MPQPEPQSKGVTQASLFEEWLTTMKVMGSAIGKALRDHLSAWIAVGGISLYLIGVIRTAGILTAEHIPVSRGLPVVELPDYLLRGLSVVLATQTLLLFSGLLLGVPVLLAAQERDARLKASKTTPSTHGVDVTVSWLQPTLAAVGGAFLVLLMVAIYPLAEWAPMIMGFVISMTSVIKLGTRKAGTLGSDRSVGRWVALLVFGVVLAWGMRAYFDPPPLDLIRITYQDGRTETRRIFFSSGQAFYLVGAEGKGTHRNLRVVPTASTRSAVLMDGSRRYFKTVPELLGLSFYRLWEDEQSNLHFEPSR
jgi:hypothetical protein